MIYALWASRVLNVSSTTIPRDSDGHSAGTAVPDGDPAARWATATLAVLLPRDAAAGG
jgi:hypothetical protein